MTAVHARNGMTECTLHSMTKSKKGVECGLTTNDP